MRSKFKYLLLIINIFLLPYTAQALNFQRLGIEQGLPHGNIYNVVQDETGFVWLASDNGLIRYDGYEFKNFTAKSEQLMSKNIVALDIDSSKRFWLGTNQGVYLYLTDSQRFIPLQGDSTLHSELSNSYIKSIVSSNNSLWILSKSALYKYRLDNQKITKLSLPKRHPRSLPFIISKTPDDEPRCYSS